MNTTHGTIYCNSTVASILEHTFGGTPMHTKKGNAYTFDPERLKKVSSSLKRTHAKIKVGEQGEQDIVSLFRCDGYISSSNNKQNIHMHSEIASPSSPVHLDEVAERGSVGGGIA
jgi:hypothetical protein